MFSLGIKAGVLGSVSALSLEAFLQASSYSGLSQDITDVDLWKYFTPSDEDEFVVHDIFLRKENNFIQGFYYDPTVE